MPRDLYLAYLVAFAKHFLAQKPRGYMTVLTKAIDYNIAQFSRVMASKSFTFPEDKRRKLAGHFGVDYESAIAFGKALLEGKKPPELGEKLVTTDELLEGGFIRVPLSTETRLAAGKGGFTIPYTDDANTSPVIVHGPSLGKRSARDLQAFRVGGDSMEPILAENGLVLVDLSDNDIKRLTKPTIYMLCYDFDTNVCSVKYVSWAVKREYLAIESANREIYPPVYIAPTKVHIVGRVIWAWRKF